MDVSSKIKLPCKRLFTERAIQSGVVYMTEKFITYDLSVILAELRGICGR